MTNIDENVSANSDYFESYDNISVHNLMLRDKPRVSKYREAILNSKSIFKDKIVLDVGSGTGLLSMFSAQAGAKHVYGVEASKGIYELSKSIVNANSLQNRITLINGEIEKIQLPVDQVDIIVSEWMGFYLLHESMLGSVIYARDKWLRKDGQGRMYPSIAYLYMCPVDMSEYLEENVFSWNDYSGLNYEPFGRVYKQLLLEKPLIETIRAEQLIDEEKMIASLDLLTVTCDDLRSIQSYDVNFNLSLLSTDRAGGETRRLHGFAFWFDVLFKTDDSGIIELSTSPKSETTHWKQTIAFLPDSGYLLNKDEEFECFLIMSQCEENSRHYQIDIGVNLESNAVAKEQQESDEDEEEDDPAKHPVPCDCGNLRCLLVKTAMENYDKEKK